ncbi:MAG: AAA family ATPase [Actinobacteria bacterium]|nr:AAA family ATPase [Actinomycetota bacterium]
MPDAPDPPPFVGRGAELDMLSGALDPTSEDTVLLLRGEAGLGKSTLLCAVVESPGSRFRLYTAAGQPLQQAIPYALIVDLIELRRPATDELHAAVTRTVMGTDTTTPTPDPYSLVLAVTERIVDLITSATGPVAFVIDDLHWLDAPSLSVLDRLLRRAPSLGLRMLLATRPTARPEVQAVTARIEAMGGRVVDLPPLSSDDSLRLLSELLGGPPGPKLTALARGAAGNPLYIAELAEAMQVAGQLSTRDGRTDVDTSELPSSFRAAVLERIGGLPRGAVMALRGAAALGTSVDVAAVAAVLGTTPLAVLADVDPAITAGLLVERGGTLAFRHDLIRAALYDDMPVDARQVLHRSAAAAVRDPGAVAAHLEAAGPPFSEADLDRLQRAAFELEAVDPRRAAALLELLLEHIDGEGSRGEELRLRRARCLVRGGDLEGAAALLTDLNDHAGTDVDVGIAVLEAQAARDEPEADLVARLATAATKIDDDAHRLEVLGVAAYHAARSDPARFRELLSALPVDDPAASIDARLHLLLARATRQALDGDLSSAIADAQRAYAFARDGRAGPQASVRAGLTLGVFGGDLSPFRPAAVDALEHATRWAEDSGQTGLVPASHALLANAYWADGDWEAADAAYRSALAAAEEVENHRWYAEARCGLTHMSADRGLIAEAQEHLAACIATGRMIGAGQGSGAVAGTGRNWVTVAGLEGRIAYGAGRDADAIARWSTDLRNPRAVAFTKAISAMDLAVVALSAGDRAALELAADALEPHATEGPPVGMVRPLVAAALCGDVTAAANAAEGARTAPVYGFGKMAEVAGLVARDAGQVEVAVTWLHEALAAWGRCGADALSRRTAGWLEQLGISSRGVVRVRPTTGWDSLTDAEWRVVPLVADGLLYREVAARLHLSRRTVETHVASVLRKLGLRSRAELGAAYWRQDRIGNENR